MTPTVAVATIIPCAYIVGAIPFGWLIGMSRGVDVRKAGSGNIGATNVWRTVGKGWGVLAFVCDFLKGLAAPLVARAIAPDLEYLPVAAGAAAVAGHMWTCFMRFKGGKGVATAFGMLVAIVPWVSLAALAIFAATVYATHYISASSALAALFMGVAVWFAVPGLNPVPPPPGVCALV